LKYSTQLKKYVIKVITGKYFKDLNYFGEYGMNSSIEIK